MRSLARPRRPARGRSLAPALSLLLAGGCGDAPQRLALPRAEARAQLAGALAAASARLGPVEMEPALARFRPRLAEASFAPSTIFDDPAWSVADPDTRRLGFWGRRESGQYRLGLSETAPSLQRLSDYRGELELVRLAEHEYQWRWLDELSLGDVAPDFLARLLGSVFLDAESGADDLKGPLLAATPRASASLGRLLRLERLEPTLQADGATHVGLRFSMQPDQIVGEFPAYARYLERYFRPLKVNLQVYDERGRRWWGYDQREMVVSMRFRVYRGRLAPLEDPPRRMPETLRARLAVTTRSGLFRVGFENLEGQLRLVRTPGEKSLAFVARTPPDWRIPFAFKPFLRSALDRPFAGDGMRLDAGLYSPGDGHTRLGMGLRYAVLEAWIVRRMGGFVSGAASEFRERAEEEANRFQGQVIEAFRADVLALLASETASARP